MIESVEQAKIISESQIWYYKEKLRLDPNFKLSESEIIELLDCALVLITDLQESLAKITVQLEREYG